MSTQQEPPPGGFRRPGWIKALWFLLSWWGGLLAVGAQTDGSLDVRFHPGAGASDDVLAAALTPVGRLVLGGYFTAYDGCERWRVARVHADGALDAGFDPGDSSGSSPVTRLAALPDGRVLVAGAFSRFNGLTRPYVVRLEPDGKVDATFDATSAFAGLEGRSSVLTPLPDGKILIGGRFDTPAGSRRASSVLLRRLLPDGRTDPSFRADLPPSGREDQINALATGKDNLLWVGTRAALIRLQADGAADENFQPTADLRGSVLALAVQADGKPLVTCQLPSGGWQLRRLETGGKPDPAFQTVRAEGAEAGTVTTVLVQDDGKILLGGSFRAIGGRRRHGLARLNPDGSLDESFDPGTGVEVIPLEEAEETPTATVQVLLPLPGGGLLAAGRFDLYNGIACHNLARLYNGNANPPPPAQPSP